MNRTRESHLPEAHRILLTVPEAARELNLGRNRVYEMCRSGEIPSLRIGNTVRISREGLHEWIRRRMGGRQ